MKRTALLFVIGIVVLTTIGFICPFSTKRTGGAKLEFGLNSARMLTYQDPDLGFIVRYPSFFTMQPDSLDNYKGEVRLSYADENATVVLECYALWNFGQTLKEGMDSLAQVLHATNRKLGSDNFVLSGPQYENEGRIDNYSYYSRFVSRGKLWFVYTMVYPDHYYKHLSRLFHEINDWKVFGNQRPKISRTDNFIMDAMRWKRKKRVILNNERD